MSMPIIGGVAARVGARPSDGRVAWRSRASAVVSRRLWPANRGVAELRWAAVALAIMVVARGRRDRSSIRRAATSSGSSPWRVPTAVVVAAIAWSPLAPRLAALRSVRLLVGPLVLAVAVIGAGADLRTLTLPSAAPLVVLAMAYAAMTPGFPIAAAVMIGASTGALLAHWEITQGVGAPGRPERRVRGRGRRDARRVGRHGRHPACRDERGGSRHGARGAAS